MIAHNGDSIASTPARQTVRMTRAAMAFLLVLPACQQAIVTDPLTEDLAGNAPDTRMAFWHTLGERGLTSNDEALHGVLLYLDGEDHAGGYDERVAQLKARNVLPAGFDLPGDEALNRGTLALLVSRMADIRGGIFMRLFPDSPRYATRELQYLGLYPRSSPNQAFSGAEFLGIMGRLEDYQRIRPVDAAAVSEPPAADTVEEAREGGIPVEEGTETPESE